MAPPAAPSCKLHVTPILFVPVTVAINGSTPPSGTVAGVGDTVALTAVCVPSPPPHPAVKQSNANGPTSSSPFVKDGLRNFLTLLPANLIVLLPWHSWPSWQSLGAATIRAPRWASFGDGKGRCGENLAERFPWQRPKTAACGTQ